MTLGKLGIFLFVMRQVLADPVEVTCDLAGMTYIMEFISGGMKMQKPLRAKTERK